MDLSPTTVLTVSLCLVFLLALLAWAYFDAPDIDTP